MLGGEQEIDDTGRSEEMVTKRGDKRKKKRKDKKEERLSKQEENGDEENQELNHGMERSEEEAEEGEEKQGIDSKKKDRKNRKKELLLKKAAEADNRGVCYLSRIPPHMDHVKLRQILSQYGEILRIYLTPSGRTPMVNAQKPSQGRSREQEFSEGWVEFARKGIAKRVANMLNGEQIGGRKRSSFFYDLWNIKYLSKFKWDDLTEEIAYKSAVREQKLALEISAAKRERDFYLNKVDQSRAQSAIEERIKKKQKLQLESGNNAELPISQPKVMQQFPQKKPVAVDALESKPQLSKDILSGIFGGS